jgi:hypothetical protein
MVRSYIKSFWVLCFLFIVNLVSGQEICNNGIDDTGNGLIDCFDPECAASPDCPAFALGSLCSPTGGSRADVLEVQMAYTDPGDSPTFTIPNGATRALVYISSHDGITTNNFTNLISNADEDVIQINAVINLEEETSSGFLTYIKATTGDGSNANLYGWNDVDFGDYVYDFAPANNLKGPILNNFRVVKTSANTFRIDQTNTAIRSSYMVEFTSPTDNSLIALGYENRALLRGTNPVNRDLSIPIPNNADVFYVYMFGTNAFNNNSSQGGTEEGYSKARFFFDRTKNEKSGYVTVVNGGLLQFRSTYTINNIDADSDDRLLDDAIGDFSGKNTTLAGGKGIYNPRIYIDGSNLIIERDSPYAEDYEDAYVVEFFERIPEPMSAEFIETQNQMIVKGQATTAGTSRTFDIPAGAEFVYFKQEGVGINSPPTENENALSTYIVIDLIAETYSGQYWQQVGFQGNNQNRRDDNVAFKNVPLNGTSAKGHPSSVGPIYQAPSAGATYDINIALSADKNSLVVTNRTGLVASDYVYILSADFFGRRPDVSANIDNISFSKGSTCKSIVASVELCNPGAGRSPNGMPVSFYDKDPTADDSAILLYTGTIETLTLDVGQCEVFDYEIDMSAYEDLNIDLTIVLNDDGSFANGVGNEISEVFILDDLRNQDNRYVECDYSNNISTTTVNVNNCPKVDLDFDLPGRDLSIGYCTSGNAVSISRNVLIEDLDNANIHGAVITLTNRPDGANELLEVIGALPAGINLVAYNASTGELVLENESTIANYEQAISQISYRNNASPYNTDDRIITLTLFDGVELGPETTATIEFDALPSISLNPLGSFCNEVSDIQLVYSGTSLAPDSYEIIFDAAALAAGFVNVAPTTLNPSPIQFPLPNNLPAGTYNAQIRVSNTQSGCVGNLQSFEIISAAICANNNNLGIVGISGLLNAGNILSNDALNGTLNPNASLVSITPDIPAVGNPISINSTTGQIEIIGNAQAGLYSLNYEICEVAQPANCATATVSVEIERGLIVSSVDCQCIDDAPYLIYNVTPNFVTTSHLFIDFIEQDDRQVLRTERVGQNYTGQILFPGAEVDENGTGINWPGWELTEEGWTGPSNFNFGALTPQSIVRLRINPEEEFVIDYPPATQDCATEPTSFLLPVTWLSFNGRTERGGNYLTWSTASEVNNDYFEIQRSIDGQSFEVIGYVQGNGTISTQSNYALIDDKPFNGYNYYRLRQVDFDGTDDFSRTIVINTTGEGFGSLKVFPNPTSGLVVIDRGDLEIGEIILKDAAGRVLRSERIIQKTARIDLSTFESGIYFLSDAFGSTVKIIKQ